MSKAHISSSVFAMWMCVPAFAASPPHCKDIDKAISRLTKEMKDAAKNLDFEKATEIRDKLRELKELRIFV